MTRELSMLHVVVSSVAESVLGHSPDETFRVEDVGELVAKFQRLEDLCSRLQWLGVRIYDLLLGVELAAWREVDAELEGLQTFSYASLGLGARQRRWAVFSGCISVHGGRIARGSDRHRDC
jgi:hypothetical protein